MIPLIAIFSAIVQFKVKITFSGCAPKKGSYFFDGHRRPFPKPAWKYDARSVRDFHRKSALRRMRLPVHFEALENW